ncbi:YueI family protein [Aquibacillus sediminis]|uniref:YueI family protein n=1 Tax=Aquibacillus sediminis TaxID=2574734 RepID=UPI00110835DD|nr:YueI family protein [Aquibacillus sediminis]
MKKDVDDYLQEGIYGAKETNPAERKAFLGTLRERVVLALTKGQVMKHKGVQQLDQAMKENPDSKLLLNGNVSFRYFKKYKQVASDNQINYKTVNNKSAESDYGIVLTYDHAIDKENIFLQEENKEQPTKQKEEKSLLQSLFGIFK